MNRLKRLKRLINPNIKVGDKIQICDGSGLYPNFETNQNYCIIYAYPDVTKSPYILKDIVGTVIKTNISNIVVDSGGDWVYGVDIEIQLGEVRFYTCSEFVYQV